MSEAAQPFSLQRRAELVTEAIEKIKAADDRSRELAQDLNAQFHQRKDAREKVGFLRRDLGDHAESIEILLGNRECALKRLQWFEDRHAEIFAALEELRCWVGQGMSAEQAGAKRETLVQAIDQVNAALDKSRAGYNG